MPDVPEQGERIVTDVDRADIVLTATLLPERTRRELYSAEDPLLWIVAWWGERDPTPGTPENEYRDVVRQRAGALHDLFPDLPLFDIPEPWLTLLKFGHWDRIQNAALRPPLLYPEGITLPQGFGTRTGTTILLYDVPEPFQIAVNQRMSVMPARVPSAPSLTGAWEAVEDPGARPAVRVQALQALSWYELPEVAERLLDIPDTCMQDVGLEWEATLNRLALRRACCLDTSSVRRLAALRAAGAPPRMQLERTLGDWYPHEWFTVDLDSLLSINRCETIDGRRGPHRTLFTDPEGLLTDLAELFPSRTSLTGWDWRGDLLLAWGTPRRFNEERRSALFIHGYPVEVGVRAGLLGTVDTVVLSDPVAILARAIDREQADRTDRDAVVAALTEMIPEATLVTEPLLGHLHRILPLQVRRVDSIVGAQALNLLTDVIAYPESDGGFDIMISLGLPFTDISRQAVEGGYATRLETCCLLLDGENRTIWSEWHDEGFSIHNPGGDLLTLFLVDGFRCHTDTGTNRIYCSVFDPVTQKAAAILFQPPLAEVTGPGPFISPIALADTVSTDASEGTFTRGDYRLLPYPGRNLLYGEDIWLYYEISGLTRSTYRDHAWEEWFYLIPDTSDQGIVRIDPGLVRTSLEPRTGRYIMIDLSMLETSFTGPLYIVIRVRDFVSGREALAATRFSIFQTPPPPLQ